MNSKRTTERAAPPTGGTSARARRNPQTKPKGADGSVGSALRTAYDETVQEDVPQEMLDLLKKLS